MVHGVTYYMHEEYNNLTYNSCKDVIQPSTSSPAMEVLCGEYGAEDCTPQRWFNYMGSTSNGFSPFDIIYEYGTEDRYYNPSGNECNATIEARFNLPFWS